MSETHKNASEIAEALGRSPSSISRIIRKYGIQKTENGYPVKDVIEAIAKSQSLDHRAPLQDGDPRKEKVELENELLRIKIGELDERLVDAEQIEQEANRVGTAIKNDLLSLPQSLAGRLAGQTEPAKIADILDAAIRDCLRHLSDKICTTPPQ